MPFAQVNGINLHYEIRGEGPRLLFIHGIGAGLKNPVHLFDSPLAERFTILSYDPRGLGESDSPDQPCTMADLADDAAGLAEAAGWDHYHVFGASMGGMVAQELALRHPGQVDKLVLVVTSGGGKTNSSFPVDQLDRLSAVEKLQLSDTRQDEAWAAAHPEMVSRMEEQFRAFREAMEADPDLLRGYNYQVKAVMGHDAFDRLPRITAPTLVFGGRYDGSCPPEITRALAAQIPGARCEIVESGHGTWFLDPAVWNMVIDFLRD